MGPATASCSWAAGAPALWAMKPGVRSSSLGATCAVAGFLFLLDGRLARLLFFVLMETTDREGAGS
ncbi:hypothetical protein BE20_43270 [Sorangium cellulosum]|nr:hypothetical protein BE18_44560 [Sorangium cellulosum]KYF96072.1 hypothetical protein BE20_43270 [Sorangium cellulosum]